MQLPTAPLGTPAPRKLVPGKYSNWHHHAAKDTYRQTSQQPKLNSQLRASINCQPLRWANLAIQKLVALDTYSSSQHRTAIMWDCAFGVVAKKSLPSPRPPRFSVTLSSRTSIALSLNYVCDPLWVKFLRRMQGLSLDSFFFNYYFCLLMSTWCSTTCW